VISLRRGLSRTPWSKVDTQVSDEVAITQVACEPLFNSSVALIGAEGQDPNTARRPWPFLEWFRDHCGDHFGFPVQEQASQVTAHFSDAPM